LRQLDERAGDGEGEKTENSQSDEQSHGHASMTK
jgi:hypothetical protein